MAIVGMAYLTVGCLVGQARDGVSYEPVLQDSEREAVSDLLQYLENVCRLSRCPLLFSRSRAMAEDRGRFL